MKIDYPQESQIPQLQTLWQEAFADDDAFMDAFFDTAFSSDRCRCVTENGQLGAMLYFLDCKGLGRPMAYLYAIATAQKYRGRGFCRGLIEDAKGHLKALGYEGLLLVPSDEALRQMYGKMGFRNATRVREFACRKGDTPVTLRRVDATEYGALRRNFLPEGGVLQEGESLAFLSKIAGLYAGEDFLYAENAELLGNIDAAPGILCALKQEKGRFRIPGPDTPFAMYYPLTDGPAPNYFGLAFD